MSAILNRKPGTSDQSEENQVSSSTTTQQNVFKVQQIQPQAIAIARVIDLIGAARNVFAKSLLTDCYFYDLFSS